jgi:hypothetical protein
MKTVRHIRQTWLAGALLLTTMIAQAAPVSPNYVPVQTTATVGVPITGSAPWLGTGGANVGGPNISYSFTFTRSACTAVNNSVNEQVEDRAVGAGAASTSTRVRWATLAAPPYDGPQPLDFISWRTASCVSGSSTVVSSFTLDTAPNIPFAIAFADLDVGNATVRAYDAVSGGNQLPTTGWTFSSYDAYDEVAAGEAPGCPLGSRALNNPINTWAGATGVLTAGVPNCDSEGVFAVLRPDNWAQIRRIEFTQTDASAFGDRVYFTVWAEPFEVTGTVYSDANAMTDTFVNGTGTDAGSVTLTAYLVRNGQIVGSADVLANGTYRFPAVPPDTGYTIVLSNSAGLTGAAPASSLPLGWLNTGDIIGTTTTPGSGNGADGVSSSFDVGSANVANVNFGIRQSADTTSAITCVPNPAAPGASVTCTLTCTNNGPGAAIDAGCNFTGTLPGGVTANTCPATSASQGTGSANALSCSITFPAPANGSVVVNGGSSAVNDSDGGNDPTAGNNDSTTTLNVSGVTVSGRVYRESSSPANTTDDGNVIDPGLVTNVSMSCTSPSFTAAPTATNADGTYTFADVPAGATCTITETQPAGYTNAYNTQGTGGTSDTGGSAGSTGNSTITLVVPNAGSTGNNFAEQSADMVSSTACVPSNPAGGVSTTCTVTCTNNGPGTAVAPLCSITNAASLPGAPTVTCTPSPLPATLVNGEAVSCAVTFNAPNTGNVTVNGGTGATNDNNGGTTLTAGNNPSSAQFSVVPADMTPTLSNLPSAVGPGRTYTGLTLTCNNIGTSTANAATCVPSASTGSVSNIQCTPVSGSNVASGGNIACTFDYLAPGTQGGADTSDTAVQFFGRTGATNDAIGGTDTTVCPATSANNNCVITPVAVIDAIDDAASTQQYATTGSTNYPLLVNDQLGSTTSPAIGGSGVAAPTITGVTLGGNATTNPFSIDPTTGALIVPNNTPPGVYVVTYQLCASGSTTACDTATKQVTVEASDMTSSVVCTPSNAASGAPVSCTLTCTNQGPNIANNAVCGFTSGLPIGVTVTCAPASPQATLAVGAQIVCTSGAFPSPATSTPVNGGTGAANDRNGGATLTAGNNPSSAAIGAPALPVPTLGGLGMALLGIGLAIAVLARRKRFPFSS